MNDTALVSLDRARIALAECKTVMETKQIADIAEAARVYLERTNASVETVNRATEVRLLAERQMGAFLREMPKATGPRMAGKDERGASVVVQPDRRETLRDLGISKDESARAQKLAAMPDEEFHGKIAEAKAEGAKITLASLTKPQAKAAGDEAEKDSPNLWRLKCLWKKAGKRDRAAFIAWTHDERKEP